MKNSQFMRMAQTPPGEWSRQDLARLGGCELRGLCELLGIPTSGTRAAVIERLLCLGQLRSMLTEYEAPDVHQDAERMCGVYSKCELKSMCVTAKLWKSGNKHALAIGLISWRNECRRKGKEAYRRALEEMKHRPRQMTLPLSNAA